MASILNIVKFKYSEQWPRSLVFNFQCPLILRKTTLRQIPASRSTHEKKERWRWTETNFLYRTTKWIGPMRQQLGMLQALRCSQMWRNYNPVRPINIIIKAKLNPDRGNLLSANRDADCYINRGGAPTS